MVLRVARLLKTLRRQHTRMQLTRRDVELPEDLHAQRALAVYLGTG